MVVLQIFFAAVLSAVATLGLGWWIYEKRVRPRLEREVERRVQSALAELGQIVEERVRRGVVRGVTDLSSAQTLRETTRKAAKSGVDIVDEGLNLLLGKPRPRK